MKRYDPESVGDVLRNLLEETALQNRMDELRGAALWKEVVGPQIAALTKKPTVANGVMTVGVPNAALRHELLMNRSSLRRILNSKIGKEIITEIKFIS